MKQRACRDGAATMREGFDRSPRATAREPSRGDRGVRYHFGSPQPRPGPVGPACSAVLAYAMIEEEACAQALILHRTHGGAASSYAAEQIAALARAGNAAGVVRWRKIADHLYAFRPQQRDR